MNVVYGCASNSWDRISRFVAPWLAGRPLIVMWDPSSIAVAYNEILRTVSRVTVDALVLVHDDLEITDPNAEDKLLTALQAPNIALVGVAGGRGVGSLAWWNAETFGYQRTNTTELYLGPRHGDVDLLEGSLLALGSWAIRNLRFDEDVPGFHGYDEIAMQARRRGKRVVVTDVDTHHHTSLGFDSPESQLAWCDADMWFREKYSL